jgi:hypothetical protein
MKSKNDVRRGVRIPARDKNLAELFGILTGDGYMNFYPAKNDYLIEIAGDSRNDKEYFEYINRLFLNLFNIRPKLYQRKKQNSAYLRVRSKGIFYFLKQTGFVTGKKEQISIPSWIPKNKQYMISFIRGLVDTDGSVVLKRRYQSEPHYPVINIVSKSKILINTVYAWLKQNGFSGWQGKETKKDKRTGKVTQNYRLELNGKKNLAKWLKEIGFSNPHKLKKALPAL